LWLESLDRGPIPHGNRLPEGLTVTHSNC